MHMPKSTRTATAPRNYQYVIRHAHQDKPSRGSLASADTAIGTARQGFEYGAVEAYVVRKTDGVRIWDGPAGISLDYRSW